MVKELYDPHMFNYMWESLDQDRFVVGTYYIEDNKPDWDFIDHLGQVQRLALEGSTASWMEVKEETPEVRERLSSKVLGYYEIPSPKGTKRAVVQLAFPTAAWDVNVNGLYNVLEIAREYDCALFAPSSIGVFGLTTPLDNTPQDTIQRPNTMYGVTKVAGELLCDYYYQRFGVDTRGLRYPGLISYETLPGGGTTDYAVEIFYAAIKEKRYTCFLKEGTYLDMMYMPDAINSAIKLMEADPEKLKHRNAFNVTAMSFAPKHLYDEIKKFIPEFTMDYKVDPVRQAIAESWPNYMDDSVAREEWGWKPEYDLSTMTKDMLEKLSQKLLG